MTSEKLNTYKKTDKSGAKLSDANTVFTLVTENIGLNILCSALFCAALLFSVEKSSAGIKWACSYILNAFPFEVRGKGLDFCILS